jgi:hypothetical protein
MDTTNKKMLRIIFDGVIAVGPQRRKGADTGYGPIFGVMARSTRTRARRHSLPDVPIYIPTHLPTLFTTAKPKDGSRPPDEVYSPFQTEWYLWHPVRERMEIRPDGKALPREITYNTTKVTPNGTLDKDPLRLHPIDRVPHARDICPDRCELLEGLMTPPSDHRPVREEVAAQILVPGGEMNGGGIWDKEDGVEVDFDPPRSWKRKVVVPNVVVCIPVENTVEIAMYSLDTAELLDPIKFDVTSNIDLWISNGDPSDTSIDLGKAALLDAQIKGASITDSLFEKLHLQDAMKLTPKLIALREFIKLVLTGSNPTIPPGSVNIQYVRKSDVDIDFELFYNLLDGEDDGELSVPVRPHGRYFDGPNCLCNVVGCREKLEFMSGS